MDFVTGLPRTSRKFDSIWVVVDRLTKSAHFIPVCTSYSSERLASIFIREIVRLHGVPVSIISDRGTQFTSQFWRAFHQGMGTQDALERVKVIQERLRTAQSRQKSYADRRVRELSFMVGEKVLLKVSPMKGVMRLSGVHPVFHVSMLRKYVEDPSHVLDFGSIQLDNDLTYDVKPVAILGRQ
uniref:Integrase catalytic domain-containing protein n=1 Tax=Nicotiana tabacum TaxID=4097 RepID=A0A1S4DP02_TOBAC